MERGRNAEDVGERKTEDLQSMIRKWRNEEIYRPERENKDDKNEGKWVDLNRMKNRDGEWKKENMGENEKQKTYRVQLENGEEKPYEPEGKNGDDLKERNKQSWSRNRRRGNAEDSKGGRRNGRKEKIEEDVAIQQWRERKSGEEIQEQTMYRTEREARGEVKEEII